MAGIKRKSTAPATSDNKVKAKKPKHTPEGSKRSSKLAVKPPKKSEKAKEESDGLDESDTSEQENGFYGFSASQDGEILDNNGNGFGSSDADASDIEAAPKSRGASGREGVVDRSGSSEKSNKGEVFGTKLAELNANSSKEAHAKQKALVRERKAAKPNADIIERSKKLWEKLRLKSHVEKEERKVLVTELFEIVTGRVKDLVFKHDSVRVIQTAIKYSTMEQRRAIARELKGDFRTLAEGKYSKFLIAKLVEKGDPEIRDLIISEFYGHVKRMINHPEAAWILDDIYRQVATPEQKSRLLREWYGPEFSIKGFEAKSNASAELSVILEESPEKRKPIMDFLENQINSLIQKKLTGFTMLHDAMLQYFLVCEPGTEQANDFLEHLKPDPTLKEGEEADNVDLLKNLAFTKSGSRLMSLCFAYGSAKDRKLFLRPYKDTIETMAYDTHAHHVLLAALAVTDDTKLTSKSIFGEILPSTADIPTLADKVLNLVNDTRARTLLLYPFASDAKWLFTDDSTRDRLTELYTIRNTTSKKAPATRLAELVRAIETQLLAALAARPGDFASFPFGQQFMTEVLLGAPDVEPATRKEALQQVAQLARPILENNLPASAPHAKSSSYGKNLLKTLVQGGKFDAASKKVVPVEPLLGFADLFWVAIKDEVVDWATGQGSFVVVSLVEAEDFARKDEAFAALRVHKKALKSAAHPEGGNEGGKKVKKGKNKGKHGSEGSGRGNAGSRILLEKL